MCLALPRKLQVRFDAGWEYDRVVEGEQQIMTYDSIALPEPDVPQASDPLFHHLIARGVGVGRVQFGYLYEPRPDSGFAEGARSCFPGFPHDRQG